MTHVPDHIISESLVQLPTFTGYVDQQFFVEPLNGSQHPSSYLDVFPDELYNKSPFSHLYKFMYALLGPAGVGGLKFNAMNARILLEENGIDLFDLDKFYGNPLKFGRILEEIYTEDPTGTIPRDRWEKVTAKDAKYRNRAIDYVNGVRAGNSPEGMRLVARSGLGHPVEIIENYRYLYDQHTDDRLTLPYLGKTLSTEEMIVLPRRELSRSESQTVTLTGELSGGFYKLYFNGHTTQFIGHNASRFEVQEFLEALPNIEIGDIEVVLRGENPKIFEVFFRKGLGNQNVPQIQVIESSLQVSGSLPATTTVETTVGGVDASEEVGSPSAIDQHNLVSAIDRIKSVTTIPTIGEAPGTRKKTAWGSVVASSELREVIPFVTGSPKVIWNNSDWVQANVERQAPAPAKSINGSYIQMHTPQRVLAHTEQAVYDPRYQTYGWTGIENEYISEHLGRFSPTQVGFFPFLGNYNNSSQVFYGYNALEVNRPIKATVQAHREKSLPIYSGHYPGHFYNLPGVPERKPPSENTFWASLERSEGVEYLEIDLGQVQPVNVIYFECTRKPIDIFIDYDLVGSAPRRNFHTVTPNTKLPFTDIAFFEGGGINPWKLMEFNFTNSKHEMVYSRYFRITFQRRDGWHNERNYSAYNRRIRFDWSVEIRNLKLGRNVNVG